MFVISDIYREKMDCTTVCGENKGTDQQCGYCTADLCLCFLICKNRFSCDAAQIAQDEHVFNIVDSV